ncbi:hypothetical protein ACFQ3B_15225 [Stackebrandtia endophytica]|nr:hypothetical protein [Stackebrandtia endophytica]
MPRKLLSSSGLALVLLATAGCAATGTFFDPTAEIKAAVAEALDDLASQPALHITGSLYLKVGMDRVDEYAATVLADGTAWAEFHNSNAGSGALISVEDEVHVNADEGLWRSAESGAASMLDGSWLRVPTDDWHDPGSFFRPSRLADLLHTEMAEADTLEIPTPDTETVDGTEVYRVPHDTGWVNVSAEAPHRFVSLEQFPLRVKDAVTSALTVGTVTVEPATGDQVDGMNADILAALPEMERPYSVTAQPRTTIDNLEISFCVWPSCTITADVMVKADTDDPHTEDLLLLFTGELYDWDTEELIAVCEKTRSVISGRKVRMHCTATPDNDDSDRVYAWVLADVLSQYTYDTEAAIEYVTQAFADVTT